MVNYPLGKYISTLDAIKTRLKGDRKTFIDILFYLIVIRFFLHVFFRERLSTLFPTLAKFFPFRDDDSDSGNCREWICNLRIKIMFFGDEKGVEIRNVRQCSKLMGYCKSFRYQIKMQIFSRFSG